MDASYWPPFEPSTSASSSSCSLTSTASPVSPADLPKIVVQPVSSGLVNYLVDRVQDAVAFGLDKSPQPSPYPSTSSSSRRARRDRADASALRERQAIFDFTASLLRRAEVSFSIVLGALVYIDRAKPHLSIAIEEWAHHRVLMGALIAAAKYLNDASLKNAHWALCSGVFGRRDVQRIEREFLDVLDFELAVKENDLVNICTSLVDAGIIGSPRPLPIKLVERERKRSGLESVRRALQQHERRHGTAKHIDGHQEQVKAQGRPEKRQKSESMDIDFEEERGRFKERRTDARSAPSVPLPRLSISPASDCSTYSSSSSSTSPASSNSPQTPPQPSLSAPPMIAYPHYAMPPLAATPSKTGAFLPSIPILALPPAPTPPTHARLPDAPLPQPLPVRFPLLRMHSGPKSALPLDLDVDAEMGNGEFAFESPTCLVPTYRPRSRTSSGLRPPSAATHRRSSALSLYPSIIAPVNA